MVGATAELRLAATGPVGRAALSKEDQRLHAPESVFGRLVT